MSDTQDQLGAARGAARLDRQVVDRRAEALAHQLGQQRRACLVARRRDPSTLGELTPQELQVALVLAEGRTTREAAAALFLSPKTIEYHLRHVYQKLEIGSREELAARFAS